MHSRLALLHNSKCAWGGNSACDMTAWKKECRGRGNPTFIDSIRDLPTLVLWTKSRILLLVLEVYWFPRNAQGFRNDLNLSVTNMHTKIIMNVNLPIKVYFSIESTANIWPLCIFKSLMREIRKNEGHLPGFMDTSWCWTYTLILYVNS